LSGAHAPQPNLNPNKRPWTDPGPNFDGHNWMISEDNPTKRPALPKESGQVHEYEVVNVHSSGHSWPTSTDSWPTSTDSGFDGISHGEIPQTIGHTTASPKDFDQAHQYQIGHVQQTNPGPSADPDFDSHNWMDVEGPPPLRLAPPGPLSPRPSNAGPSSPGPSNLRPPTFTWLKLRPPTESDDEVFQGPSPTQELTDSEHHYGLSSTDSGSQEAESRLQPTERSLASDPGRVSFRLVSHPQTYILKQLVSSTVVLAHPHMVSEVNPETK